MKLRYLILFLFIASGTALLAQEGAKTNTVNGTKTEQEVKFVAKVSKSKLGINERLRVDFEMNQDGDNFNPPDFKGFRVVGGPNQSVKNSYINGKRFYSKTYSYFLAPQSKGSFTIGQANIEINGSTYKTVPIKVQVTSAVAPPKTGNNSDVATENVHLVAEVSKSRPYLNEAITVVYKLYVGNDVNISSSWREIDTPKYADFWSQNIESRGNYKIYNGTFKGEDYRYVVLRTTILYPQKTGKLNIEPLTLDVPIDVISNRRDIFGRRLVSRVNKTISAGRRTIDVKPLPEEGKPLDFTGAVGDFTLDVNTNKTNLDANESLELTVAVNGKGNLKLFDLPSVKLPSSLEVYEPERSESVRTNAAGMGGQISEKYIVVPQFKGTYPIRPINFSYFDPTTETYKTLNSQDIVIQVENGPISEDSATNATETSNKKTNVVANNQFKFIALEPNLEPISAPSFFKSKLFWTLLGGPFMFIPIFILIGKNRRKRRADVQGNRLRKANKLAKKYLTEAKKNVGNQSSFYEALERALHNYLKAKLNIETSDMSKDRISQLLKERSISQETVSSFENLLKSCEFARYTPASSSTIKQDYGKAVSVISEIDKQII